MVRPRYNWKFPDPIKTAEDYEKADGCLKEIGNESSQIPDGVRDRLANAAFVFRIAKGVPSNAEVRSYFSSLLKQTTSLRRELGAIDDGSKSILDSVNSSIAKDLDLALSQFQDICLALVDPKKYDDKGKGGRPSNQIEEAAAGTLAAILTDCGVRFTTYSEGAFCKCISILFQISDDSDKSREIAQAYIKDMGKTD